MDDASLRFLLAWTPTLVAGFALLLAGLVLGLSIAREERKKEEDRKRSSSAGP